MSNSAPKQDFGEVVADYQRSPRTRYPWEIWTDGQARRLTKGKHFNGSTETMATAAYAHGRKLRAEGKKVKVCCHQENDSTIIIQFKFDRADKAKKSAPKKDKRAKS